jgi:hypothetical protein
MNWEAKMLKDKETKGTFRYAVPEEERSEALCRSVYLRKEQLGDEVPEEITLTISF